MHLKYMYLEKIEGTEKTKQYPFLFMHTLRDMFDASEGISCNHWLKILFLEGTEYTTVPQESSDLNCMELVVGIFLLPMSSKMQVILE